MFNIFKKTPDGELVTFKINGMHCTSCSMNIDGELEETEGVISSDTSYAKGSASVKYDKDKISPKQIKSIISKLGYSVTED